MEKNIFKNSYFGKAYRTKSGDKVILVALLDKVAYLLTEDKIGKNGLFGNNTHAYRLDGICKEHQHLDIDSEWKEEINEEELDELAEEYFLNTYNKGITDPNLDIINEKKYAVADFKAGYRKAKEN